jgi:hypothetical protein
VFYLSSNPSTAKINKIKESKRDKYKAKNPTATEFIRLRLNIFHHAVVLEFFKYHMAAVISAIQCV